MKVIGVTFARNAIHYDYPLAECLASLAGVCDEVIFVHGDSHDQTGSISLPPNTTTVNTQWDENLRQGGLILSQQTNIGVNKAWELGADWVLVLQADEVIHQRNFAEIRRQMASALPEVVALRFRYLHFWQRFDQVAYSRRWYPQEIRAIRRHSGLVSFGDAQTFRLPDGKAIDEIPRCPVIDAFVYHYGHVRAPEAYGRKLKEFHRWWHSDEGIKKLLKKKEPTEKVFRFLGSHPPVMADRMVRLAPVLAPPLLPDRPPGSRGAAASSCEAINGYHRMLGRTVVGDSWFASPGCYVPRRLESPQALPWPQAFYQELLGLGI